MRDHLEDNWGFYAVGLVLVAFIWLLVASLAHTHAQRGYCLDRGMILVETEAGPRCARLDALERIR